MIEINRLLRKENARLRLQLGLPPRDEAMVEDSSEDVGNDQGGAQSRHDEDPNLQTHDQSQEVMAEDTDETPRAEIVTGEFIVEEYHQLPPVKVKLSSSSIIICNQNSASDAVQETA